ncbi:MAG: hypothetical protein UX31_C0009G0012 [Candidatus Nomurabacteria bacterium GW2011_GWA1_46_11]|uniref:Uncharacterized protein n=1 Tax=Candidatus Nomurabacteria bacterium GW2011_GWA1_46_11 TaxID=1618732 RepID=A0A0G1NMV6_9BACT|nr:MAG: hypothetical protein UW69_C0004G0011 [Microgenomates group bacterium GW2011_GWA2_44_7]KKT77689.1 MAG: hypothetical protein UW73_C0014G0012 [Microgenomates group bacterium GW2011_GWB1_44_8]KKU21934.1 MAG: hypothetical protein UX31_C0009G0012 [Candidatus Nomurabacteria bacterium GW2011_GWA1_46_11]
MNQALIENITTCLDQGRLGEEYRRALAERNDVTHLQGIATAPAELVHVALLGLRVISLNEARKLAEAGDPETCQWLEEAIQRNTLLSGISGAVSIVLRNLDSQTTEIWIEARETLEKLETLLRTTTQTENEISSHKSPESET